MNMNNNKMPMNTMNMLMNNMKDKTLYLNALNNNNPMNNFQNNFNNNNQMNNFQNNFNNNNQMNNFQNNLNINNINKMTNIQNNLNNNIANQMNNASNNLNNNNNINQMNNIQNNLNNNTNINQMNCSQISLNNNNINQMNNSQINLNDNNNINQKIYAQNNLNNNNINNAQNNLNNNNINNVQNNLNNNNNQMNNIQNNLNINNNQMNNVQKNFNNNQNQQQAEAMSNNNIQNFNQNNQNYLDENIQITTISDANEMIKALIRENNNLKKQLSLLSQNFEKYKKTMDLNCYYNQFDLNAFRLDEIYKSFESKNIIQKKEEFGLINRGIRHLFNKNIVSFQGIYSSSNDEFELSQFKETLNQLEKFVLLVSLKENSYKRRFGIFCNKYYMHKDNQVDKNINNQNNMNMNINNQNNMNMNINNQMNPVMGMGMVMPMMNNANNIPENRDDSSENETIFDSSLYLTSCFLFSLEDLKIYYKETIINGAPNFIIKYNNQYQCLLGSEGMKLSLPNQASPDFILYKLSGKPDFKIKNLELFVVNY